MYDVQLTHKAERGLRRVRRGDPAAYHRISSAIRLLAEEPRPTGVKKLKGVDPPAWRLRVGGYRVVYEIRERQLVVMVVHVAPRGEVYR